MMIGRSKGYVAFEEFPLAPASASSLFPNLPMKTPLLLSLTALLALQCSSKMSSVRASRATLSLLPSFASDGITSHYHIDV